jgi:hypothetical protein
MARVSVAGLNGQPAVLASYFNGNFGDQLAERNGGGTWTVQQADFLDDSGAKLIIDETGEPAFFGSSGSGVARYYFRRGGTWQFDTVATGTNIVGLDAAIIDSTPTVAYLDRNDSKLHFRQKIGGNWNDTILETGAATDYDPLISLMDLNGAPAITYILSAGTGAKPLIYQQLEVPEPTSAMILGLVGAMGLSVRRRRAS